MLCVMKLIYIYYTPDRLLPRLVKKYRKIPYSILSGDKRGEKLENDKKYYFEAISKILFYSIKIEGEPLARKLQVFYYEEFLKFRENEENPKIVYPDYFYDVFFAANECLCQRDYRSISFYNNAFYDFFFDEDLNTIISEKTYRFFWMCLCQSILYNKDEFVISYWHKANQYYMFRSTRVVPEYDITSPDKILNEEDIIKRDSECEYFLEFHYAFGGFLMMKEKYSLLYSLFSWTNFKPAKYYLVPETMEEVISRFVQVEAKLDYKNPVYYASTYPFYGISGVDADDIIKMWIKRYIAILFLRQYTLQEYFTDSRILDMPDPPKTLSEKRRWKEELNILKYFITEYLKNIECLEQLNMREISSQDWFDKNNKPHPKNLIDNLIQKIEDSIEESKNNQEIDSKKQKNFDTKTIEILNKCFKKYAGCFKNTIKETEPHQAIVCGGRYEIFDKMAFAADQDISYSNSEYVIADSLVIDFKNNMPIVFRYYKTTSYLLKESDLFSAISTLGLNVKDYTIVSVGIRLKQHKQFYAKKDLNEKDDRWEYCGIPIIELDYTRINIVNKSLFLMKNEDLPSIVYKEVSPEIQKEYYLKRIDKNFNIYTSIIDLNKNEAIRKKVEEKTNRKDLSKCVLVGVDLNTEIRCKISAKCIQLKVFSQFDDKGNPNKLEEIKSVW